MSRYNVMVELTSEARTQDVAALIARSLDSVVKTYLDVTMLSVERLGESDPP